MTGSRPKTTVSFAATHPWDRAFFAAWITFAWVGVLGGFGPEVAGGAMRKAGLTVALHGAAATAWMLLVTL